jgi:hypothetical protein
VVNLPDFAPHRVSAVTELPGRPQVIAVPGTSMNSGKSTTLGSLVNGLNGAGLTASAGKATGTGSGNDPWLFTHAGTQHVLDFTDFGFPTTFLMDHATVRGLLTRRIDALTTAETDVVVVEIADRIAADCQGGVRADRCAGHQYVRSVHAGDGTEAAAGEQVGR